MPKKERAAAVAAKTVSEVDGCDLPRFVDALHGATIADVHITDINLADTSTQFRVRTRVEDLRAAIQREGQTDPVDLFGSKPYRIIDGFRRVQAIKELGWPTVKAIIHLDISEAAAHEHAFTMNVVRRNLSAVDRANAIRLAKTRGLKDAAIAEAFGLSEKQLRRYEALLDFDPAIRGLLDAGEISMAHAKLLNDFDVTNAVEWAERIQEKTWSAADLRRELKTAFAKRTTTKARPFIQVRDGEYRAYARRFSKSTSPEERTRAIAEYERLIAALRDERPEPENRRKRRIPQPATYKQLSTNHAVADSRSRPNQAPGKQLQADSLTSCAAQKNRS